MEAPTELAPQASLPAQMGDGFAEMLDTINSVDAMIASLAAVRAQVIDDARRFSELADIVRTPEPHSWKPDLVARKVLVSELAAAMRIPRPTAENLIEQSRALVQRLPGTLGALKAGTISYRHAEKLVDQAYSLPPEAWGAFEEAVLPSAKTQTVVQFTQKARKVREAVHPESIAERTVKSAANRSVTVDPAADGMAWLTAYLPAEQAIAIHNRLTDIGLHLRGFEDRGFEDRGFEDEERTMAQLRADVLADLLIDGDVLPTAEKTRGMRATVNVTVPVLTLLGNSEMPATLEGYGPISPDVARELAAHAPSFTRILTHPETGVVLSVGREKYRPPADLQMWVRMRDGTCRCPGCRVAARKAELDHTTPWAEGGETSADNLASLCPRDHALKTHTGWKTKQIGGGKLEWTAPWSGRIYITEPDTDLPS